MSREGFNLKIIGAGTPVIMLHGFFIDQTSMVAACEPIFSQSDFKRIYFDQPGMGLNSNIEGIENADDMIQCIGDFVKETIGEIPFYLVGMSYGGYLARGLAHALKDQCLGMFLFAPVVFPKFDQRKLPAHEVVYEDMAYTNTLEPSEVEQLRESNVIITRRIVERQKLEFDEAISKANGAFLEAYQSNGYEASFNIDENASNFNGTLLILAGKQDSGVGYEDQFLLSQKYKRASYMVLDGAGHGLHIEKEQIFNHMLEQWIDDIKGRKPI